MGATVVLNCQVCGNPLPIRQINKKRKNCSVHCGRIATRRKVDAGEKVGMLTIVKEIEPKLIIDTNRNRLVWIRLFECQCECGNLTISDISSLFTGHKISCGCYVPEKTRKGLRLRHGLSKTRIHQLWLSLKQRCYDPNTTGYERYGGRGVRVCDEWVKSFESFHEWAMSNGFREDLVLDKDKIGNGLLYSPNTCCFITAEENGWYKRNSLRIKYEGVIYNCKQLSEKLGITRQVVRYRNKKGYYDS